VVRVERGAVVDEPGRPPPDEKVRVAVGAVRVGDERVEPHDARRQLRRDEIAGGRRIEVERAVEVADPDVDAMTRAQEVLDLRIRLGAAERRLDVHERELRHRQPEGAREQPHDDLRDERLRPLARAAELHDEEPSIVRVDDGGQRPALAQRLHVSGGDDGRESAHAGRARVGRRERVQSRDYGGAR
jgi:hypothetical protein